jgi:hypothetical protein
MMMPAGAGWSIASSPRWTFHLLQKLSKKQIQKIAPRSRSKSGPPKQDNHALVCRICGHPITSAAHIIEVDGHHHHTCTNPKGIRFHIRCFAAAPGCLNQGDPTSDFTWFAGYAWNYSLCCQCLSHLGWFFQSGSHSFFGLINDHLLQQKSAGP